MDDNTKRELRKVLDVLRVAERHFRHEAEMNAALHMAASVRPAPLAVAIEGAAMDLEMLLDGIGA